MNNPHYCPILRAVIVSGSREWDMPVCLLVGILTHGFLLLLFWSFLGSFPNKSQVSGFALGEQTRDLCVLRIMKLDWARSKRRSSCGDKYLVSYTPFLPAHSTLKYLSTFDWNPQCHKSSLALLAVSFVTTIHKFESPIPEQNHCSQMGISKTHMVEAVEELSKRLSLVGERTPPMFSPNSLS